jgi:hypothetical protein
MSVADPTTSELVRTATEAFPAPHAAVRRVIAGLVALLQGAAFWIAALLPLAYVPLLAAGVVADHPVGFLGLAAGNAVAFVVGYGHDPVA